MIEPGAVTGDIDLIQVLLVMFFLFFAGLVAYLRREDKREGYPLVARTARHPVVGWPAPPPPKVYRLMDGTTAIMPHVKPQLPLGDRAPLPNGMALVPPGDPVLSGLGAGAFVARRREPMRTPHGHLLLEPLRRIDDWNVAPGELELRGMPVLSRDHWPIGRVCDLWIDRVARMLRYVEIELDGGGTVLAPIFHCVIAERARELRVSAVKAAHFADVPRLADPDQMTTDEEDRLNAFYAGASIYSDANWAA